MAFNPFRRFRKNQKTWLAVLTILSMFSFIAVGSMAGVGDFFGTVTQWLAGHGRFPVVATLYGKDIDRNELSDLRYRRRLANLYMEEALKRARDNLYVPIGDLQTKYPATLSRLAFLERQYAGFPSEERQALENLRQELMQSKRTEEAALIRRLMQAQDQARQLPAIAPKQLYFGGSNKLELEDLLDFMIWRHQADVLGIQLTSADIVRLVKRDTQQTVGERDFRDIDRAVGQKFGRFSRELIYSVLGDEFRVRLAKTAILGSPLASWTGSQGAAMPSRAVTPYEFWQRYRNNRTQSTITLLPIPVNQPEFLAKVRQPTDAELKELFTKYKDKDYDPGAETAGFKQPPRIRVEWIGARPDSPAFRQEAVKAVKQDEAVLASAILLQASLQALPQVSAGGTFAAAGLAVTGAAFNQPVLPDLLTAYEVAKGRRDFQVPAWTQPGYRLALYTSLNRPFSAAAMVGQLLGAAGTQGTALSAAVCYPATAYARDAKDLEPLIAKQILRHVFVDDSAAWLSWQNPNPFASAALWDYTSKQKLPLSLDMVKGRLMDSLYYARAKKIIDQQLDALRQELKERSQLESYFDLGPMFGAARARSFLRINRAENIAAMVGLVGASAACGGPGFSAALAQAAVEDRNEIVDHACVASALAGTGLIPLSSAMIVGAENQQLLTVIRAPIDKAIASGRFDHGSSARPDDLFDIEDDPGLKPLKEAYLRDAVGPRKRKLADVFFSSNAQPQRALLPYNPNPLTTQEESFYYWQTAEEPAYVPTFAEAKKRVAQRWRLEQARAYAEKKAEQVAAEARKTRGDPLPVFRDMIAQHPGWGPLIDLRNVARLVPRNIAVVSRSVPVQYDPYMPSPFDVEYPAPDFADELLKLKERGEVRVVHDRPKMIYYVAALDDRLAPSEHAFYYSYHNYANDAQPLLARIKQESKLPDKYQTSVILLLRAEAGWHINEENRKEIEHGAGPDED